VSENLGCDVRSRVRAWGVRNSAEEGQGKGDGEIGDVVSQNVGRVGDGNVFLSAFSEVDIVVSDAVGGDNLEFGQGVDGGGVHSDFDAGDDGADGVSVDFGEGGEGGKVPEFEEVEALGELFLDVTVHWASH